MFVSGNNVPSWWATRFSFKLTCSHGVTQRNNGRHISLTYIPNLSLYRTIEEVKFFSFPLSRDISSSRERKKTTNERREIAIFLHSLRQESTRFLLIGYHDNQFIGESIENRASRAFLIYFSCRLSGNSNRLTRSHESDFLYRVAPITIR